MSAAAPLIRTEGLDSFHIVGRQKPYPHEWLAVQALADEPCQIAEGVLHRSVFPHWLSPPPLNIERNAGQGWPSAASQMTLAEVAVIHGLTLDAVTGGRAADIYSAMHASGQLGIALAESCTPDQLADALQDDHVDLSRWPDQPVAGLKSGGWCCWLYLRPPLEWSTELARSLVQEILTDLVIPYPPDVTEGPARRLVMDAAEAWRSQRASRGPAHAA